MIHTQKKEGSFHTIIDYVGLGKWDNAIYIPAGLAIDGNTSSRFFDFGQYPHNDDKYMRHLTFTTPETPDIDALVASGKALMQLLELSEAMNLINQTLGSVAVDREAITIDGGSNLRMVA